MLCSVGIQLEKVMIGCFFFSCFWPNLFHWSSFVSIAIYRRLNKFKFTFRTCIWSTQIAYRILLSDSCSNSYYIVMHYWLTVECNTKTRNYSRSIICISLEACSKVKTIFQKRQQVQWQFSCVSIKWCQISSFDIAHNVTKLSQVKKQPVLPSLSVPVPGRREESVT